MQNRFKTLLNRDGLTQMISNDKLLKPVELNKEVREKIFPEASSTSDYAINYNETRKIVDKMIKRGYSFACWEATPASSVLHMPIAAFIRGPRPPESVQECGLDDKIYSAFAPTLSEAICYAALFALRNDRK